MTRRLQANKLRKRAVRQTWAGRIPVLLDNARARARNKALSIELDVRSIEAMLDACDYKCPFTGIPFDLEPHPTRQQNPYSPSLDRIDPAKGYTVSNTRVVSWVYNSMKGEGTDAELLSFALLITG